MSFRRIARLVVCCLLALACASTATLPSPAPGVPDRVLLISVARLTAWALWDMPTLTELATAGALAEELTSVAPATAYPVHATLVTGATPASHGVVADHRLGDRGVRSTRYAHASYLKQDTLWQRAIEAGQLVASLDWPSTLGSSIPLLLPDASRPPRGGSGMEALADAAPKLRDLMLRNGGNRDAAHRPGPERDAMLTAVACGLLTGEAPPQLLLMRLGQSGPAIEQHGSRSSEATIAFSAIDRQLATLLGCLDAKGLLESAAIVVVGDHGTAPVHTEVAPNAVLAREGLLQPFGAGVEHWSAITRSNGGTAFLYARDERAALLARVALENAGHETGAYRVVPATEMIRAQADAGAWFGLEAEPGFAFLDTTQEPLLVASRRRAAGGYLPQTTAMDAVLVAWGRGVRQGIKIPEMRQTDVAPTLARLIGLRLEGATGRVLVGVLSLGATTPVASGADGPDGKR